MLRSQDVQALLRHQEAAAAVLLLEDHGAGGLEAELALPSTAAIATLITTLDFVDRS